MALRPGPSFGNGAFTTQLTIDDLTGVITGISYTCKNGTAKIIMKPALLPQEITNVAKGDALATAVAAGVLNPVDLKAGGSMEISWSAAY
jgi:hypothetical protein